MDEVTKTEAMGAETAAQGAAERDAGAAARRVPFFHVMTKPIGPICNLDCKYCFYLEKEGLYPEKKHFRMAEEVLEEYIRQYIGRQAAPEVAFAWQGGEPTLLGVEYFRKIVALQKKYCPPGQRVTNAMQTNGTLLDEEWCEFLREENFLVGLSIDGPERIHDIYRVNKGGKSTFKQVMRGMELLKKHRVEFNTLTVVHRQVAENPLEVYHFLKTEGSGFLQFIPVVERVGAAPEALAEPPLLQVYQPAEVTPWSVDPEQLGTFLCEIFDYWVRHDVGKTFVQLFDVQLGIELGMPAALCVFAETCGAAMAMEHNGDLYSCDHFVYPRYRLGNILEKGIPEMLESEFQKKFGNDKRDALPGYCLKCPVLANCRGECPKHRFLQTPDGEPGLNYLCAGYRKFFTHMKPEMAIMAELLRRERPAADVMEILAQQEGRAPAARMTGPLVEQAGLAVGGASLPARKSAEGKGAGGGVGRNEACPCGSGRKFKKCCGKG